MLKNLVSIKEGKFKQLILAFILCLIIICIITNPNKYINVCLNGILIFGKNILPALLPFIFFTKLLTSTGYVEHISKYFAPLTKKFYNCPAISSYIFTMSVLSGYPLGAKITADLYERGIINRDEAHRICSFTSNSGPMFIVGTVGSGMLCNEIVGYIILISHILAALLNGFIYRKYKPKPCVELHQPTKNSNSSTGNLLSECMENSIASVLLIGGYIAIFFIITEILASLHVFSPITTLLKTIGINSEAVNGVLNGFFEITNGCNTLAKTSLTTQIKTLLCSFVISFGGLAVSFQGLTFLNKFKISKSYFFLQKFTHAVLSMFITLILILIIPL